MKQMYATTILLSNILRMVIHTTGTGNDYT
jgi:hypothetical protein